MEKGEIFVAKASKKKNNCFHPMIYLGENGEGKILAACISHRSTDDKGSYVVKNKKMESSHFYTTEDDPRFIIQYGSTFYPKVTPKDSYLCLCVFAKELTWIADEREGEPQPHGKLRPEGLQFVENELKQCGAADYIVHFDKPIWRAQEFPELFKHLRQPSEN